VEQVGYPKDASLDISKEKRPILLVLRGSDSAFNPSRTGPPSCQRFKTKRRRFSREGEKGADFFIPAMGKRPFGGV